MTVRELHDLLSRAVSAGRGDLPVRFEDGNGVLVGDAVSEAYSYDPGRSELEPELAGGHVYVVALEITEEDDR